MIPFSDRPAEATLFRGVTEGRAWRVGPAQLAGDVESLAARLPPAPVFVIGCRDRYWFTVAFLAALRCGAVSLFTGDQSPAGLAALAERYPGLAIIGDKPRPESPLAFTLTGGRPGEAGEAAMPAAPANQPALIVFTSGSTGQPTGTPKNWGELAARSRAGGAAFDLTEATAPTVIATVPPNHMYGAETSVLLPLHAPASAWSGPFFYPADIRAAIDAVDGPRILVTTPLQLRALLRQDSPARPPERVISATAPLDHETAAAAETAWGCTVEEIFGASEVGSIARRRTTEGPVWRLYPGIHLSGTDETPMIGAEGVEPRRLTDVIETQPDGRSFRLIGRSADLIKLGGRRASLAGLAHILIGIEGVEDGAFLAPDDLDSSPNARLIAFVVAPARPAEAILADLRRAIDPVFLPRRLIQLPRLPRTAMGKLPRQALLDLLAAPAPDEAP